MLAVGTDLQFRRLVEVLGSAELGSPRFAGNDDRLAHRQELQVLLDGIFSQRTVGEWSERLAGMGVPFSPIYELDGAFSQDSIALGDFVGLVETPAGEMPTMRSPLRIDGVRPSVRRGPRQLGEDNAEF
jgi:crotonobetainyl-CoA:carnitine CoA-transferase CaiB-like acyl-CoA transferase